MLDTELQRYAEENAARWGISYMQVVRKMLVESSDAACFFEVSRYTSERAGAYESIGSYHGFENFDSYPHECTEKEIVSASFLRKKH